METLRKPDDDNDHDDTRLSTRAQRIMDENGSLLVHFVSNKTNEPGVYSVTVTGVNNGERALGTFAIVWCRRFDENIGEDTIHGIEMMFLTRRFDTFATRPLNILNKIGIRKRMRATSLGIDEITAVSWKETQNWLLPRDFYNINKLS